jgi:hypothetical protein
MANQVDPATAGGMASGDATAHGAVAPSHGGADVGAPSVQGDFGQGDIGQRDIGQGAVAATANVAHLGPYPPFHGRRVSWVAVSIIMAGFLISGLSLIFGHHGPTWWVFWVGAGAAVLGVITMLATNTFEDWY